MRMGRYEPTLKRWYYSGPNERSQWTQFEADEPYSLDTSSHSAIHYRYLIVIDG
jgi:hypothetical protein